jgi:hypothetical protein
MFYNDAEGARAMANSAGFQRTSGGLVNGGSGLVSIGLRDEHGGFLSGFVAGGKNYVIGEAGRRYSIVVRNRTQNRLEIVVSVDGLDVIDGRPAAFSKRGYLVDPQGELEIDGFRQSVDTVAAFRFGSVRGSYASQKHGDSRNVGVIGLAVFHERGTNPAPGRPARCSAARTRTRSPARSRPLPERDKRDARRAHKAARSALLEAQPSDSRRT